jgi:putative addiction module component (TIGR02574 family)
MELCRSLWEDIAASDELTPGEAEEIERRLAEHLKNPDDVVEWNEVRARLDAKYKK